MIKSTIKKHLSTSISLMLGISVTTLLSACGGSETKTSPEVIDPSQPVSDWQMVWNDEFDGETINSQNWSHAIDCDGGGNQEKQCYTDSDENSYVADGILNIVALPAGEDAEQPYTSARLSSRYKADFKYGRFEMRAKLPSGQGSWPAFWMLPTDEVYGGWPNSGEIDIVESVNLKAVAEDGSVENQVHGTLHYGKLWPDNSQTGKSYTLVDGVNPADDFHTYAVEWQEGEIRWYVDNYLYATQRQSKISYDGKGEPVALAHKGWFTEYYDQTTGELTTHWDSAPYDQDFYLLLNYAVGGDWPENVNNTGVDAAAFTAENRFEVDYVRVYQCQSDPETGKGCETVRPGYDSYDDALLEGEAPPVASAVATNLTIFSDNENPLWPLWDCCAGSTPTVEQDVDKGAVAQFEITGDTVMGFNSRLSTAHGAFPFNAAPLADSGFVSFDMKVINLPDDASADWHVKLETPDAATAGDLVLTESLEGVAPVSGVWQTYTFPLSAFADKGLDLAQIDVVMVFPAWGQGAGAVYQIDNLEIGQPLTDVTLFEDDVADMWTIWDCCTGSSPAVVMDDAEHGATAEFAVSGDTVMGFLADDNVYVDASSIAAAGVITFDMKATSMPTDGSAVWKFKVESGDATSAVELDLINGNGGEAVKLGEWQTYTFPLTELFNAGLDISALDVVMIFPEWGKGSGAVYRVDNARIYSPEPPKLTLMEDDVADMWTIWDCCAGSTPTVVADDEEHGNTAEFAISGDTVMGFLANDQVYFNASSTLQTGVVSFEMKVISAPGDASADWKVKLEAGDATSAVELSLIKGGEAPVIGEWQTYTYSLKALFDAGLDISQIDVVMIFPEWGKGAGAVYRVDNAYIGNP